MFIHFNTTLVCFPAALKWLNIRLKKIYIIYLSIENLLILIYTALRPYTRVILHSHANVKPVETFSRNFSFAF